VLDALYGFYSKGAIFVAGLSMGSSRSRSAGRRSWCVAAAHRKSALVVVRSDACSRTAMFLALFGQGELRVFGSLFSGPVAESLWPIEVPVILLHSYALVLRKHAELQVKAPKTFGVMLSKWPATF